MSDVTLTIDGREVTVAKGTTLLAAAQSVGTEVPHYCYHPGLSSPAMCRLCLVEVEGAPKLLPSCVTTVQDGQVVHTDSESARAMREGVLEFYLVNHPLDCPICDQSGECKLQDYVHEEGRKHGRSREPKRVFGRDDFGGDVLFYGDRCVMCTRCVRFMNEVERDERLTVVERGNRSVIDTFFDEGLDGTRWSGNVVDICPVGALVSKDFLHKQRSWDLEHTPSVCPSCSQGCNIDLHSRDNRIQRLRPRANLAVNAFWMCDRGRANYEWINREDRAEPSPGVEGQDGTAALAERLRGASEAGQSVRAVASPLSSLEELGALRALVDQLGGGDIVYRMTRADDEDVLAGFPALARRRELAPNGRGADLLGMTLVGDDDGTGGLTEVAAHDGIVLVLGDELADQDATFGSQAGVFVHLSAFTPSNAGGAAVMLPLATFAEQEGTFTNRDGRVQRFWSALEAPQGARPGWRWLGELLASLTEVEVPSSAAEAFARFVAGHGPFDGLDHESLGARGAPVNEPASVAGGRS